jgi:hypothetical protein
MRIVVLYVFRSFHSASWHCGLSGARDMNPADAERKKIRQKEILRNKKERQFQRDATKKRADPSAIRAELQEVIDLQDDGNNHLTIKLKKKALQSAPFKISIWSILIYSCLHLRRRRKQTSAHSRQFCNTYSSSCSLKNTHVSLRAVVCHRVRFRIIAAKFAWIAPNTVPRNTLRP